MKGNSSWKHHGFLETSTAGKITFKTPPDLVGIYLWTVKTFSPPYKHIYRSENIVNKYTKWTFSNKKNPSHWAGVFMEKPPLFVGFSGANPEIPRFAKGAWCPCACPVGSRILGCHRGSLVGSLGETLGPMAEAVGVGSKFWEVGKGWQKWKTSG